MHVSGIAVTKVAASGGPSADVVSGNQLMDYSFITQPFTTPSNALLRCSSGLGPSAGQRNLDLGGWSFKGAMLQEGGNCGDTVFQVGPANGNRFPGIINLLLCGAFTTADEGIYSCTMMNSSMVDQTMRVGVYFNGRSESFNCHQCNAMHVIFKKHHIIH